MSRQPGKTLIGAFIMGGLALAAAAVIVFGSGRLIGNALTYVLYFDGSVQGLSTGSPVVFRGVKVGSVTDIRIHADLKEFSFQIPVIIEIEPDRMIIRSIAEQEDRTFEKLVRSGLRGQLLPQSMLTGQYMVNLDLFPDTPARFVDPNAPYPEIPTVPSPLDRLARTIRELPLSELAQKLLETAEGIERMVNSDDTRQALHSLSGILDKADRRLGPMADSTEMTLAEIRGTAQAINKAVVPLLDEARGAVAGYGELAVSLDRLAQGLETALDEAHATLGQGRSTLRTMEEALSEDTPLMVEIRDTLKELGTMSRSIRHLADYLKRHPESIMLGKEAPGGK